MVCVTFKFVCFDGIEGKNHADEELRKKKKREEDGELSGTFWNLESSGTWRRDIEKERKEGNKGKEWVRVWTGKKEGKKKEKKEENAVSEWRRKKMKKKEILSQYFHNKY